MMSATDILTGARDAIARHGWRKGAIGSTVEGFCVYGALDYVMFRGGERDYTPGFNKAVDALAAAVADEWLPNPKSARQGQIAAYNDRPATTVDDINAVLERAIKASK